MEKQRQQVCETCCLASTGRAPDQLHGLKPHEGAGMGGVVLMEITRHEACSSGLLFQIAIQGRTGGRADLCLVLVCVKQ